MLINLWKDIETGPKPPEIINVIVEIPAGSRNKYEYQKHTGGIRLDRVLSSSLKYPGDYGLIPRTHFDDGDPLDVLVMVTEPTFPGCIIEVRPIGIFRMLDKGAADDKVLAVPVRNPLYDSYHDLKDVPPHYLKEVAHFFSVYKDLEGVRVEPIGWETAEAAHESIRHSMRLYREKFVT
jgi:inorganic pyrophosphatase